VCPWFVFRGRTILRTYQKQEIYSIDLKINGVDDFTFTFSSAIKIQQSLLTINQ